MTPARAFFESQLLPSFAGRFSADAFVLNIGAGKHSYRDRFVCRVVTSDPIAPCDERWCAESIPYADRSVDAILLIGVFERLDDPMQAMRELRRVLKAGGLLLLSALDLSAEWRKPTDRWRLTMGGFAHVVCGFVILETHHVDGMHFAILQKGESS